MAFSSPPGVPMQAPQGGQLQRSQALADAIKALQAQGQQPVVNNGGDLAMNLGAQALSQYGQQRRDLADPTVPVSVTPQRTEQSGSGGLFGLGAKLGSMFGRR